MSHSLNFSEKVAVRAFPMFFFKEQNLRQSLINFICVQLMSFLMQLNESRIRMSAAGLFKVGKHLIPSVSILLVIAILSRLGYFHIIVFS